ncbi:MAG: O-acetylhomoserine aminocarboxypropyltransferase/cysteine synthase [Coriobacteriia bacterium]|nr:O-acetylhomoserine aminocarboxypropyltransferase/cysteine synthase [Coriobacteriia bacterium]
MGTAHDPGTWGFETKQLHVGQEKADPATDSLVTPIYQTMTYAFHSGQDAADRFALKAGGHIYSRISNPTEAVFEERIAALEGGTAALAVASGSAAITYVVQALCKAGEHFVAAKTIYGGTYNLLDQTLPDYGIMTTFVDPDEGIAAFDAAIQENTRGVFIESLGNPNSNIIDIEAVAAVAHAYGIPLIVDNTFATPYLLRPLELGADIVIHSASKFIGGHGATLGGVIVDGGFDWAASGKFPQLAEPNASYHGVAFTEVAGQAAFATYVRGVILRDMGAALAPLNAWLLLQGLETLSLRVERHVENTKRVLAYLEECSQVERVNHPALAGGEQRALYDRYFPNGAGSIFTVDLCGAQAEALRFIDALELFSDVANVADVKSLVIHPATTTHSQLTDEQLAEQHIGRNTIRLSIGCESIEDILADLDQAFRHV